MATNITIKKLLPISVSSQVHEIETNLSNTTYIGIDFGTSTTVVSIASFKADGSLFVKPVELNQKLADSVTFSSYKIPTVIALYQRNLIVGEGAKALKHKLRFGKNLWHSFKMELGEDFGCRYPESELGKENSKLSILNPVDAATIFFKYLKVQIERYVKENNLPTNLEYAISIPASFEANQRKDLIQSIESNGMRVSKQSLIDEPNAAFLSYVFSSELEGKSIKIPENYYPNILVFDFGAGTCDISILEIGKDNHGIYSKNIAISRFEKLGGNNIDELIAVDILLPQLLENTKLNVESFRTKELKELIIPKLLPAAEKLKIKVSESIALKSTSVDLIDLAKSNESISIGTLIEIDTSKELLVLEEPRLSFKEFADIIEIFTIKNGSLSTKRIEKELEFISVFTPIESALKKANLTKEKVDYVLFIGGSAKNPFIQKTISEYFSDSEKLIPKNLQAHVSSGAAIHSMIYNGYGKNVIQPITSEPIMLITKDGFREKVEPIVEAGTVIPSELKSIDNLKAQREGQEVIELPICVGNKNKILYNIKIFNSENKGFSLSDKIKLDFEINTDKMLLIRASAGDVRIMVEPLSPFTNKELSTEDRIRLKAEKDFNLEIAKNGGVPTLEALRTLHKAYEKIQLDFKAAETLELIEEMFPGKGNFNNIGLHYSNAGKKEKAISFYEKAMNDSPNASVAFNLAIQYRYNDNVKYKKYLERAFELNPQSNTVSYTYGELLVNEGKVEQGQRLQQEAFDRWQKKFDNNQMEKWDYSWFASCARTLGKHDYAQHIEASAPNSNIENIYNSKNLTQTQQEEGLQTL